MNNRVNKWLLMLILTGFACTDNTYYFIPDKTDSKFANPGLNVEAVGSPFTGVLEVWPCKPNTTVYFGNYNASYVLQPFIPTYIINNGSISKSLIPILLPVGEYNLIYWGVPNSESFDEPSVNSPVFSIGKDFADDYFSMRPLRPDTTFNTIYDFVYGIKQLKIGTGDIAVSLERVVAGINVIFKSDQPGGFDDSVESVKVLITGVAEKINAATAVPENQTKTVAFPLTMSEDRMEATNKTVFVFPSRPSPVIQLWVTLKNGQVKKFKENLKTTLAPGVKLTVTIVSETIFSEQTSGNGFNVRDWNEKSEEFGPVIFN